MRTSGGALRFTRQRRREPNEGGTGPDVGRPARPLFATPGIPPDRSRAQGYTVVIQRASRTLARMGRALVLNATDVPLAVLSARRAVVLVLKEKADVVASNGAIFRSEHVHMDAPSVVRLRHFVHVPYRPHAPLTRRGVFAR